MTRSAGSSKYDDLFFATVVDSYVSKKSNPRFLRRDWLADAVAERLKVATCRFLLLTAEPSAGKSTFMAQLAHDHPDWPRYFIRRDQRQPLANAGARSFLMRVGFQLAETYPNLLARDDIVLDVDQEVGAVDTTGEVLGIDIKKLVASPFYQRVMVKVKQTVEQTGGSIRGIRIDTVIANPRLLSLNDLQELALFDPARRLRARHTRRKVVILVDALDELRYHDTKDNILQWLTGCPVDDLPDNVRFVLTSRPPDQALRLFHNTQKANVETIALELDEGDTAPTEIRVHLQKDVLTYADQLVAQEKLKPYWAQVGKEPAAFAADAAVKAEGNLGYLDAIGRALDQAIDQNDAATVRALLSLRELPRELGGLYAFFLNKVQERVTDLKVKVKDPSTGETVYVRVWEGVYLPILGVLSVAFAPLSTQQTHDLGQIDVSLPVTSSHLDRLQNFLDPVRDGYRLYHSSLAEFLSAPQTAETAPGLYCDPTEWHGCIADHYWRIFHSQPEACDLYGWHHVPAHLVRADQGEKLRQLLLDFAWLQAKLGATDVTSLIADYDLLPGDPDVQQVGDALRLSAHVLAGDKAQLWTQLYGRLMGEKFPAIQEMLAEWPKQPWLRPLRPSLTAPGEGLLGTLAGHTSGVSAVAVYDGGRRAISASWDGTLKVWDLESSQVLRTLEGHSDSVRAVAVYDGGRRAISASKDHTLKIWNLESGQELCTLKSHSDSVEAVAVCESGGQAISASWDHTLKVWDLENGQVLHTLKGHSEAVLAVALYGGGRRAISASKDHTLKIWNLESGQELRTLEGHSEPVWAVAVYNGGRRAISASGDKTLKIWDLEGGKALRTLEGHDWPVYSVAVYDGGRRAISSSLDRTLKVWDLEGGKVLRTLRGDSDSVYSVAVYNGGQRAISASGDHTLKLWDLEGGQKLHTQESHTEWVTVVVVYDGGRRAISGSLDHALKIWDLESGQVLHTLVGHKHDVLSVAVYDGGRRAISASRDDTLKVWDLESGEPLRTLDGHNWVNTVAVYDGGRRAISGLSDGSLKVWDLESYQEQCTLKGHTGQVRAVVVHDGGQRAISASNDHTLKVWDLSKAGLESGQALRTLEGHTDSVGAVVVYDRGRRAISASDDTTLKVWDLEGDQEPCTLAGHARHVISGTNLDIGVNAVAVYDDGRRAISASRDKTLKVWDLERCQEVHTLEGHTGWVNEVAVYDHGQWAISASSDNTLRIWDLESGVCLAKFSGDSGFTICRVAPDDRTVVAGDAGGQVHILRLEGAI
jgi:WD40 repeat protein